MTNRIKWSNAPFSSTVGRVNGQRVFSTGWGNSGIPDRPYTLYSELPGKLDQKHFPSREDAHAHAETVLAEFMTAIGATFTAPEES